MSDSTTFMGYILKPLASSILFTWEDGGGKGGDKTQHPPKPLIEINGMFAGAKTAKDLATGET